METLLAAAGAALGVPVSDPVDLHGGARTTVLRCASEAGPVIVKSYRDDSEALGCFAREAAGLAFTDAGPRLLGVDRSVPLVVQSDLGSGISLIDALTGADAALARRALRSWAAAYGSLAGSTVGRFAEFDRLRVRYDVGGEVGGLAAGELAATLRDLPEVSTVDGVGDDIAALSELDGPRGFAVFSPGDVCPDNNVLTEDGMALLDFEGAGYRSVFLDAAYLRMPFSSCWCVFRLPEDIAAEAEAVYRARVAPGHPELAEDRVWEHGMRLAVAAWTMDATNRMLRRAERADGPLHPKRSPCPSVRQFLRYRWQRMLAVLEPANELPALSAVARTLLARTAHWRAPDLPVYPAFRG